MGKKTLQTTAYFSLEIVEARGFSSTERKEIPTQDPITCKNSLQGRRGNQNILNQGKLKEWPKGLSKQKGSGRRRNLGTYQDARIE